MQTRTDIILQLRSNLDGLMGQRITMIEHRVGQSDADEAILITTETGTILEVGTSEWLHVTVTPPREVAI